VGIANPDPSLTREHEANKARANPASNPFTYFERQAMIKAALISEGLSFTEFELVPFPINYPAYIPYYVPTTAIYYITIYDEWGYAKKKTLEVLGLKVEVLAEGPPTLKLAEGTIIRNIIRENGLWEKFVPQAVAQYLVQHELLNKIHQPA
jgi:hypothetical protein